MPRELRSSGASIQGEPRHLPVPDMNMNGCGPRDRHAHIGGVDPGELGTGVAGFDPGVVRHARVV